MGHEVQGMAECGFGPVELVDRLNGHAVGKEGGMCRWGMLRRI